MSAVPLTLIVAGAVLAIAAALRSTWSPCGLSMLSTITPIGERGRGHRYRATATWFVIGALLGGTTTGGLIAGLAFVVDALHLPAHTAGAVAAGALVLAGTSDLGLGGLQPPFHRRQVNERWLDQFRPWVYGLGFGWQIGTGLTTYVMTAAVYALVVLGALTASPIDALALGSLFGLVRGIGVLLGRGITSPEALRVFHRRFDAVGPTVRTAVIVIEGAGAVALAGVVWPPAALILAVVATIVAAPRVRRALGAPGRVSVAPATEAHR
ncbi:MAG TPA: hypothetical protein VGG23_03200 [Acidimicrobiales bacterium]